MMPEEPDDSIKFSPISNLLLKRNESILHVCVGFFNWFFFSTVNSIKSAGKLIILTPNLSTPANTIHETMKKKNTSRVRLVVTNTYFGPNTYFHQADLPY